MKILLQGRDGVNKGGLEVSFLSFFAFAQHNAYDAI